MMSSETDRISIPYYTNTYDDRGADLSMFIQDFYQDMVPVHGSDYEFIHCELEPENVKFNEIIHELFPSNDYTYKKNLNDIVLTTLQLVAQYLVYSGRLVFELVTRKDIDGRIDYKLEIVHGEEVKIVGDKIIQVMHRDAVEQLGISEPIVVPAEKCFVIEFPKSLGGREGYLKYLEDFKKIEDQNPMMNYFKNPLVEQVGYVLKEHQRLFELELWRKSKVFNWHHRESRSDLFSRYYQIYRRLQFRKSKIILRDYIIVQLTEIVDNISTKLGCKTELKIEGLISLERIDEELRKWKAGESVHGKINEVL
ncbi:hypothetical protein [Lewinella sp. LCG006]|uniref:hypothetical protein n=1 Tax=Lewinella sp. LCG006 TaxID=3231911 RepID=UPI00346006D5